MNKLNSLVNKLSSNDPFWDLFFERFTKKFEQEIMLDHKILYHTFYSWNGRTFCCNKARSKKIMFRLKKKGLIKLNCDGFYWVGGKQ